MRLLGIKYGTYFIPDPMARAPDLNNGANDAWEQRLSVVLYSLLLEMSGTGVSGQGEREWV